MKHKTLIATSAIYFLLALLPQKAFGATPINNSITTPPSLKELETIYANVIQIATYFGGVALLFILLSGGIKWATSGGDPKKYQQAQQTLVFGLLGMVILSSAILVLGLIKEFTGIDVLRFVIDANP
jgi:hypothetical protein